MKKLLILLSVMVCLCSCSSNTGNIKGENLGVAESTDSTNNSTDSVSDDNTNSENDANNGGNDSGDSGVDGNDGENSGEASNSDSNGSDYDSGNTTIKRLDEYDKYHHNLDELNAYVSENPLDGFETFKANSANYFVDPTSEDYQKILDSVPCDKIKNTITNVFNFSKDYDGLYFNFFINVMVGGEAAIEHVLEANPDDYPVSPALFVQCIPYYMYKEDITENSLTIDDFTENVASLNDDVVSQMKTELIHYDDDEYDFDTGMYRQIIDMQSIPYFDMVVNLVDLNEDKDPSERNIIFSMPIETDIYSSSIGTSKYVVPIYMRGHYGLAIFDENDKLLTIEMYQGYDYVWKNIYLKY